MQNEYLKAVGFARDFLDQGRGQRLAGWKKGLFYYDCSPALFSDASELKDFTYNSFCGANLSKFLVEESKKPGAVAVLLKPCDRYSFNQLTKEHQISKENVIPFDLTCGGMLDASKLYNTGLRQIKAIEENEDILNVETSVGIRECRKEDMLLAKCLTCKSRTRQQNFTEIETIEQMTPDERYGFWRSELSKCMRCNACRNACPACTCGQCVFDNLRSGIANKAHSDSFEENLYHLIRSFHVAGRCTDCGECSRVCPQGIPLHLLSRKIIKDINNYFGPWQAGEDDFSKGPLTEFDYKDADPGIRQNKGGAARG